LRLAFDGHDRSVFLTWPALTRQWCSFAPIFGDCLAWSAVGT
jgi:hypothetical protein